MTSLAVGVTAEGRKEMIPGTRLSSGNKQVGRTITNSLFNPRRECQATGVADIRGEPRSGILGVSVVQKEPGCPFPP